MRYFRCRVGKNYVESGCHFLCKLSIKRSRSLEAKIGNVNGQDSIVSTHLICLLIRSWLFLQHGIVLISLILDCCRNDMSGRLEAEPGILLISTPLNISYLLGVHSQDTTSGPNIGGNLSCSDHCETVTTNKRLDEILLHIGPIKPSAS